MSLTHWKKLENPDYIGAYAFQPGETKTVTINHVDREMIAGADGKREECTVVHFREHEKPLVLNSTNAKMITRHAGTPYIEQWPGTRINLAVEKVKAFGETMDAVRVSKTKPPQNTQEIKCADCGNSIKGYGSSSPQAWAVSTKKRFGVSVCYDCGLKRAEAAKSQTEPDKEEAAE